MVMIFCRNTGQTYKHLIVEVIYKLVTQGTLKTKKIWLNSFVLLLTPFFKLDFFPSTFSVLIALVAKLLFSLALISIASNICRLWLIICKVSNILQENQCFKPNILTLITPDRKKRVGWVAVVGRRFDLTV